MLDGYGNELLSYWRQFDNFNCSASRFRGFDTCCISRPNLKYSRLPFIAGRDFCGTVVAVGGNVKQFKLGDEVTILALIC